VIGCNADTETCKYIISGHTFERRAVIGLLLYFCSLENVQFDAANGLREDRDIGGSSPMRSGNQNNRLWQQECKKPKTENCSNE